MTEVLNYIIAPKTLRRFVDNGQARSQRRSDVDYFIEILNKHDPIIKYTVEFEVHRHSLGFKDISITSNTAKKNMNSKYIERT